MFVRIVYVFAALSISAEMSPSNAGSSSLLLSSKTNALYSFDLETRALVKLGDVPVQNDHISWYENLELVDQERFVFGSPGGWVGIYDTRKKQEHRLLERARCPIYIRNTGELFFTRTEKTATIFERYFYVTNLSIGKLEKLFRLKDFTSDCPIKTGNGKTILVDSYDSTEFDLLDVEKRSTKPWMTAGCNPLLGLNTNQIICAKNDRYYIYDLIQDNTAAIDEEILNIDFMFPVVYLEELNAIVFQEYRERAFSKTVVNVWLLDIETLQSKILIEDFIVQKRGVIYREKAQ